MVAQNICNANLRNAGSAGLSWQPLVKNSPLDKPSRNYRTEELPGAEQPLDFTARDTVPAFAPGWLRHTDMQAWRN